MSDLFIGSNFRPNRPEAVNYKPVSRPGTSPTSDAPSQVGGNDQFIKSREKNREKVFGEKSHHEKRSIEKEKEKFTHEKDRGEKGCFEKKNEKLTKEKDLGEKKAEKAIWPPESKGGQLEKKAEKMSVEKRNEKWDEKTKVEKHSEKGQLEKMNVEKRSEKWVGEKHLEIEPHIQPTDALPSERFFYK